MFQDTFPCKTRSPRSCATVVLVKFAEGAAGGGMYGLLSAAQKWNRVHHRGGFSVWRFRCIIVREVKCGCCAGVLAGLLFGALELLAK